MPYYVWRLWKNDRNLWRNEAENGGSHDSLKLFQKPDSRGHWDFSNYCKSKTRDPQEHVRKILCQNYQKILEIVIFHLAILENLEIPKKWSWKGFWISESTKKSHMVILWIGRKIYENCVKKIFSLKNLPKNPQKVLKHIYGRTESKHISCWCSGINTAYWSSGTKIIEKFEIKTKFFEKF